eukprot:710162-Amphidinium_carterae.1
MSNLLVFPPVAKKPATTLGQLRGVELHSLESHYMPRMKSRAQSLKGMRSSTAAIFGIATKAPMASETSSGAMFLRTFSTTALQCIKTM